MTALLGFDGVTLPKITVSINCGGTVAPAPDTLILGVGPTLATARLGGGAWTNVTDDLMSIRRGLIGRSTPMDSAGIGPCTFKLDNESGNYDSSNPNGIFLGANLLTSQQYSLEAVNTNGWVAGTNTSIASQATVGGYHGLRALQLNKTISTGMASAKTTKTRFPEKTVCKLTAQFKAGTTGRPCKVRALFYDDNDTYISGADLLSGAVTDNSTGWVEVTVIGVSPALTGSVEFELQAATDNAAVVGENHYCDAMMKQPSGIEIGMPIRWTAEYDGVPYGRFQGTVTNISMDLGKDPTVTFESSDALEVFGRTRLARTGNMFDGDTTGVRIGHIADQALFPSSLRVLDTGYTTLGPTQFGEAALELMKKTEMTEFGLLFVNGDGFLVFYDRHRTTTATRSTTVQVDLEQVELTVLEAERGRDGMATQAIIMREATNDEDVPVEQVANDGVSQTRYGVLEFSGQVGALLKQDEDALLMAQGLVHRFRQPKLRISEVRVSAITLDLWATLLALTLLDRIRASRNYGPNTITAELLIQGIVEEVDINPPRWDFTFSTSAPHVAPSLFILGTSQLGSGKLGW
jgi:hypothetical protein